MKTFISVVCNACGKEIKSDETVYCSECLHHKDESLQVQDEKIKELRQRIDDMAIQMSGGDEEAKKKILKDNSKFTVKDEEGKDVDRFIDDIKYLTSAKWIKSTYGRMKKDFQKAYPDEALPFEEK